MSTYVPPDARQVQQMDAALAQLDNDIAQAQATGAAHTGFWDTVTDIATGGSLQHAGEILQNIATHERPQLGDLYDQVVAGEADAAAWFDAARAIDTEACQVAGFVQRWDWQGFSSQVEQAAKEEVQAAGDAVKKTVDGAALGVGLAIPIALALVVLYVLVVTRAAVR